MYNEEKDKSEFVMVDNMEWFNVFGLIFIAVIMIPNVVFAIKCKDGFDNKWNNKYVEVTEQVGRLGCFGFMIINIPGTWFGWWSDEAFALYLIVDTILVMLYCAIWIICFKKNVDVQRQTEEKPLHSKNGCRGFFVYFKMISPFSSASTTRVPPDASVPSIRRSAAGSSTALRITRRKSRAPNLPP